MKPGYGLELIQTQRLALTPELRQAIMVLQMNALELSAFIREQVEENPLIDLVEEPREEALPDSPDLIDEAWLAYFCDRSDLGVTASHSEGLPQPYETLAGGPATLREHMSSQLGLLDLSLAQRRAGEYIIGNVDDNGYLRCSVDEVAGATGLSKIQADRMLSLIQTLDPPGVGARDLRECLAIQARASGKDGLVARLIDTHLDDLAKGRYAKIAKEKKVTVEQVLEARDELLKLDPKPGAGFSRQQGNNVYPEIRMDAAGGQVVVSLDDSALPRVRWNAFYRGLLSACDQDAKQYLLRQARRARALLRSIQQRQDTIVRVMNAVAAHQEEFLREGPGHLEPLTMKDVAFELDVHESTVSRCVSNKYALTPYGVYPCKAFFSPRVSAGGGSASQESIKGAIQEIIRSEDRSRPLADQDICTELSKLGMTVARRTVSKYRRQLHIQPSGRRKAT